MKYVANVFVEALAAGAAATAIIFGIDAAEPIAKAQSREPAPQVEPDKPGFFRPDIGIYVDDVHKPAVVVTDCEAGLIRRCYRRQDRI